MNHGLPLVRKPTRRMLRALFPRISQVYCHVLRHGGLDYARSANNSWAFQPSARPCGSVMDVGSANLLMHECSKAKVGPHPTSSQRSRSATQASGVAQRARFSAKTAHNLSTNTIPTRHGPRLGEVMRTALLPPHHHLLHRHQPSQEQPERLARNQISRRRMR